MSKDNTPTPADVFDELSAARASAVARYALPPADAELLKLLESVDGIEAAAKRFAQRPRADYFPR